MRKPLINTSDLAELIASKKSVEATARSMKSIEGFVLYLNIDNGEETVLSTYLSDKPRLFKRADALLKEAEKMGLERVSFDLKNR